MTLSIKFLGSNSKGNCALLTYNNHHFLIDAGLSGKKIKTKLQTWGIDLNAILGIFITHEHYDHVVGLKALRKIPGIKFYANRKTVQAIETRYSLKAPWVIFDTGETFIVKSSLMQPLLAVQTFPIPHDATEPVGFFFKSKEASLVWATDIGHITDTARQYLLQADTLVLEANHDPDLLWLHPSRPHSLKERIAGPTGHLSNDETFAFLSSQKNPNWKHIYLAHVSLECNSTQLLQNLFYPLAQQNGFRLEIIDPLDMP